MEIYYRFILLVFMVQAILTAGPGNCQADEFPSDIFSLEEGNSDIEAWNEGIYASSYGGPEDRDVTGCIDNVIRPNKEYMVALPSKTDSLECLDGRLQVKLDDNLGAFRVIEVKIHGEEGPIYEATVEDVGPWFCEPDPYWEDFSRPAAEDGEDLKGRCTNLAGIDLSYRLATDMGIKGVERVDWRFKRIDGEIVVMEKETVFRN